MSGFAGMIRSDGGAPNPDVLDRIAAALAFRGPDSTQACARASAGFCFTLLRTGPSPQSATQPCSLDGKLWLLGDVRLDGREDLLLHIGSGINKPLSAITDEELLLRACQLWGTSSLERLTGDLSFALWDEPARQLWCARDLIGARPFFYAHIPGQLFFSNTLNALRLVPEISADLDLHFIGDFLLQSWCLDPQRSAFAQIRRLPAGHLLSYRDGQVEVRRFATLPIEEPLRLKNSRDYIEQFRFHFEQAVRDRLPAGPAAVFMSGGLDSTSVAATAAQIQRSRHVADSPRAYTVDYSPLLQDDEEGRFAPLAANHIGIAIDVLRGASSVAPFTDGEGLYTDAPEPCAEPFIAFHVQYYRLVAGYSRVALTGDGGDDILTGRAWPHLSYLLRKGRIPTAAAIFGGYVLRHGAFPPLGTGIRGKLRRWFGQAEPEPSYPAWLNPVFERELCLRDRWRELQQPPKFVHPFHPGGYASLTSHYWSGIYETEDPSSTSAPVETRAPFLDLRLIRFLLRLPPIPWCMNKNLLRQAMLSALPDSVRLRRKTPLAGDPLLLHAEKNGWKPPLLNNPCPRLAEFVDFRLFAATSHPARCLFLWDEIRPLALDVWLKGVENQRRIL